jgi:hypothetical protein
MGNWFDVIAASRALDKGRLRELALADVAPRLAGPVNLVDRP